MYPKVQILLLFLAGFVSAAYAQENGNTALIKGKLSFQTIPEAANDVQLSIPHLKQMTTSGQNGEFVLSQVPYGTYDLVITGGGIQPDTIRFNVNKNVVDLGTITVAPAADNEISLPNTQIPTALLEENENASDDESATTMNVSGLLTASRDPFMQAAAFTWSPYWFSPRGYESDEQEIRINGVLMNDAETGDAHFSQWGGLNDVIHWPGSTYGLQPSDYSFGGLNGTVNYEATAGSQRKQTRITYSLSNRQYRHRLMVTKSSGWLKNGMAYSLSFSKRWAKEGYVPGTFYDAYSYYAAVSKRLGNKHVLNLTALGAPSRKGKAAFTYQEAYDLAGSHFYNSNWGYQNGEKRNARIAQSFQPVFILSHKFNPSDHFTWNTALAYQAGKNGTTGIDWYNAPDPRPDYYKFLPSYYLYGLSPDPAAATQNQDAFINDPQIHWDELYQANYVNRQAIPNPDGSPSTDTARRSVYVQGNNIDDLKKWTFNTVIQKNLSAHLSLFTGISMISQRTESYKELLDLLGGDFFVDVNSFTERNFAGTTTTNQNDLNYPYRIVKEGDKYYYDYLIRQQKASWWGQAIFTHNKLDLFVSARYGFNSFQREGLFRNGLFSVESFGKSEKQKFSEYGLKGGVTYKINGRNYLFVNVGLAADAPAVDHTFFSVRIRNNTIENPVTQKASSLEAGYMLHAPRASARVVGYVTDIKDQARVQRFFYTGTGSSNSFVDVSMEHIDTRSTGLELALSYKISTSLSASVAAAIGQSFFTNNVTGTYHNENTFDTLPYHAETFYIKNFYQGVGPQSAYTAGLNYQSKKYWRAGLSFNYLDRNYIDIAGPRRAEQVVDLLQPGTPEWDAIVAQEKLPAQCTADIFASKSFLLNKFSQNLPRNTRLAVSMGVNNLLDNKEVITGAFENLRFDYAGRSSNKFANKYLYGCGRNYFINLALSF